MRTKLIFPSEKNDVIAMARDITKDMFAVISSCYVVFSNFEEELCFNAQEKTWSCSCSTYSKWKSMAISGYENYCSHIIALEKLYSHSTSICAAAPLLTESKFTPNVILFM